MKLKSSTIASPTQPVLLSSAEVNPLLQKLLILDVQNPRYMTSTIPQAKRLNVDILLRDIPADQPILLVCLDGYRSVMAANQLLRRGYLSVYVLQGGVIAWQQAGYTIQGITKTA